LPAHMPILAIRFHFMFAENVYGIDGAPAIMLYGIAKGTPGFEPGTC
jgi:hypothetical protein